jgi:hypothetical protein
LKVADVYWLVNDIAIEGVTAEALVFESHDPREMESRRRTERKDIGSMRVLCDDTPVRQIAVVALLDVICYNRADNALVALESNTIAGPVF